MVDCRGRAMPVVDAAFALALFVVLAAHAGAARAQVYRCIVDGRVVYTDKACGAKGIEIPVEPPAASTPPQQAPAGLTLQQSAGLGRVLVGMTQRQVEQAWGTPAGRTSEQDSRSTTERWSYAREGDDIGIHFEGGMVARITRTKAPKPAPAAADPLQSLTVSEIEERERVAKAGERRFLREGMTQEEVRGKLGPPVERRFKPMAWGTGDCWTWLPAPKDPQTRTLACFNVMDLRLVSVDRTVER